MKAKLGPKFGKKIAWVTSGGPVEPLVAMGIYPVYPENYGAVFGAAKKGVTLCEIAEGDGYSRDLCSYARGHIGAIMDPSKAPFGGLPKPDMLICSNNICGTVLKWYEAVNEKLEVPFFLFDTPFVRGEQSDHSLKYAEEQMFELVEFLERHSGRKMKPKKLQTVITRANRAVKLWTEILETCKVKPSPLNCADRFLNMAPIVVFRGTNYAVKFYEVLLAEVKARVNNKLGAIYDERIRLLWDNIPIWFQLYDLFNSLSSRGIVFPVDTYTHAWSGKFGTEDPYRTGANVYSTIFLNRDIDYRIELMAKMIKDYSLDGFVMHSDRSCKPYSLAQLEIKRALTERTGVPGVMIDGDMCDSRSFSEAQMQTRLDALLEMVGA